ncbi:hypothetical protein WA026_003033 [Henosepilachna vigintioctopunctata]|uniref:Apolipoprotein D n=1 Tax=Henosepilachna vigintioctopunctata TaxID=420089 RepID=A0AAW1TNG7_9CUCU
MLKIFVILIVGICGTQGQVPVLDDCPDFDVVENFDLNRYLGKWYEQYRYANFFELMGKCVTAEYSLNANGSVNVHNAQVNILTGKPKTIDGYAVPAGEITEAKFIVNFPVGGFSPNAPYWVLDTDYETYSVVWSCEKLPLISTRFLWLLSREQNASDETVKKMYAVLDKYNIDRSFMVSTEQENCS